MRQRVILFSLSSLICLYTAHGVCADDAATPEVVAGEKTAIENEEGAEICLSAILTGIVVDRDTSKPIGAANVSLCLDRNPFHSNPQPRSEKWTATTDADGSYVLRLDRVDQPQTKRIIGSGDEVILKIAATGYRELTIPLDAKEVQNGVIAKQIMGASAIPGSDRSEAEVRHEEEIARRRRDRANAWAEWKDDTQDFRAKVAIVINGEFILCGPITDRYSQYFVELRKAMRQAGATAIHQNPQDYRQAREAVVQRELAEYTRKVMLVQYLKRKVSFKQWHELEIRIDQLFAKELGGLQQELKVSTRDHLAFKLQEIGTSRKDIKQNLALNYLAKECVTLLSEPADPVTERDVLEYYESHRDEYVLPATVTWRQIKIRPSSTVSAAIARKALERARERLQQGDAFEDVLGVTTKDRILIGQSYGQMKAGSLVDQKLESWLFACPLNEWSEVREDRPSSSSSVSESDIKVTGASATEANPQQQNKAVASDANVELIPKSSLRNHKGVFSELFDEVDSPDETGKTVKQPVTNLPLRLDNHQLRPELSICLVTAREEERRKSVQDVDKEIREILASQRIISRSKEFVRKVVRESTFTTSYRLSVTDLIGQDGHETQQETIKKAAEEPESCAPSKSDDVPELPDDASLKDFNAAIRKDQTNSKLYRMRGARFAVLDAPDDALANYDEAIRLDPHDASAFYQRGALQVKRSLPVRALADFDESIQIDPTAFRVYEARDEVLERMGLTAKIIENLTAMVGLEKDDARIHSRLAWYLATCPEVAYRDGKRAVELSTRANELTNWTNHAFIETLAVSLAETGEFEDAKERLQQAIKLAPDARVKVRSAMMDFFSEGIAYREPADNPMK